MDIGHILTIIGSAVFMIFFFGLCIFVHELGHFLVAKWRGFHVIAFSIGFRKIWSRTYKGVEYRIGWIPFGGYVDIPQIDSAEPPKDEHGNPLPKGNTCRRRRTALQHHFRFLPRDLRLDRRSSAGNPETRSDRSGKH